MKPNPLNLSQNKGGFIAPSTIGKDIVAGLKGIGEKVKTMYANNAKARVMYTEQVKAGKTPLDAQKAVAAKYGAGQSALSSKAGSAEIPNFRESSFQKYTDNSQKVARERFNIANLEKI